MHSKLIDTIPQQISLEEVNSMPSRIRHEHFYHHLIGIENLHIWKGSKRIIVIQSRRKFGDIKQKRVLLWSLYGTNRNNFTCQHKNIDAKSISAVPINTHFNPKYQNILGRALLKDICRFIHKSFQTSFKNTLCNLPKKIIIRHGRTAGYFG